MTGAEVSIGIDAAVAIIELAAKIGPGIYAAIQSHGGYSDAQKAALIARVKAAGNYRPRDLDALPQPHDGSPTVDAELVPDPKPTAPG